MSFQDVREATLVISEGGNLIVSNIERRRLWRNRVRIVLEKAWADQELPL